MYRELLIIGFGIYGIILTIGFLCLAMIRPKKVNVRKELLKRMMEPVAMPLESRASYSEIEPLTVRKVKAFPYLERSGCENECQETVILDSQCETTELLQTEGEETEVLEEV